MSTLEAQLKRFQKGTILAALLETIIVIFWQRKMAAQEISGQPNIDRVTWRLLITLRQVNNEEEQAGRKEIQNGQFKEKKHTRKLNVRALVCAPRDEKFKERPEASCNEGHCASGQDPGLVRRKCLRNLLLLKQRKATKKSLCKCNSKRGSGIFFPSRQLNLAASALYLPSESGRMEE